MDINSVEFYTIALLVAVALIALLMRQREPEAARTHIVPLDLEPTGEEVPRDDNATPRPTHLRLTALADGKVALERDALPLRAQETVNLVATVIDDKVTIEEKKGMTAVFNSQEHYYNGSQTLTFLPFEKVYIRYESQVTGRWAKFAFLNREGNSYERELTI